MLLRTCLRKASKEATKVLPSTVVDHNQNGTGSRSLGSASMATAGSAALGAGSTVSMATGIGSTTATGC